MLARTDILTARARCGALPLAHPPGTILEKLARRPDPAVLESSARHQTYGRHTIMACDPLEVLTLRDGVLSDAAGNTLAAGDNASIWAALSRALSAVRACQAGGPAPYLPGWIGYVGYEVGRHVEKLPSRAPRDTALPDLRLAFYDALLIYDTVEARWSVVELEFDDPPNTPTPRKDPPPARKPTFLRRHTRPPSRNAWTTSPRAISFKSTCRSDSPCPTRPSRLRCTAPCDAATPPGTPPI